jgi:hypothetical protein
MSGEDFDGRKFAELVKKIAKERRWEAELADGGWTEAHQAAQEGTLPADFDKWRIKDNTGWTVAHEAGKSGTLPADLSTLPQGFWEWTFSYKSTKKRSVAHVTAFYGNIPSGFSQWAIRDGSGKTVAHDAAYSGSLPDGFTQWSMADNNGTTVAHVAARCGGLPEGFTQWSIADNDGRTVAHDMMYFWYKEPHFDHMRSAEEKEQWAEAHEAPGARVPESFEHWGLVDKNGWTVAHEAATAGILPASFTQWDMVDNRGRIIAFVAAEHAPLPVSFTQWDMVTKGGRTVAHVVAAHGRPPIGPSQWDKATWLLTDDDGTTVLQEYKSFAVQWEKNTMEWLKSMK